MSSVERWQAAHDAVERERARYEQERATPTMSRVAVLALSAMGAALAIIAALVERF